MTASASATPSIDERPVLELVDGSPDSGPSGVDELGARIVGLAGRIAAATCRWLLLIADFDRRDGHQRFGLGSTAQWLTHACGVTHRTAVEHVRVARALAAFPALAEALESGRISYSHARAISRLPHEGEHALVDDLLNVAEHGSVGQLETMVCALRTVEDNEAVFADNASRASRVLPGNDVDPWTKHPDDPTVRAERESPVSDSAERGSSETAVIGPAVTEPDPSAPVPASSGPEHPVPSPVVASPVVGSPVVPSSVVASSVVPSPVTREYVRHGWDGASSHWSMSTRLDPERGALVEHAIAALAAAEGITRVDAVVRMAEIAIAALNRASDGPPRGLRGDERAAVLLHVVAAEVPQPAGSTPATDRSDSARHTKGVFDEDEAADTPADASADVGADVAADVTADVTADLGRAAGADIASGVASPTRPTSTTTSHRADTRSRERDDHDRADALSAERHDPHRAGARSRERDGAARPTAAARPFAWLDDGPGIPRQVIEKLLCSCRVRPVVHDANGSVLDLGRSRRVVDSRLLRALLLRDRHCAHPGCRSRHKLEAHHVIHWLHGGPTNLANLVMLCQRHHHAHHDDEFIITRIGSAKRGRFEFRRRDGLVLDDHIDPSRSIPPDLAPFETEFPGIADRAMLSRSIGDRLDRGWAVAVLADRRVGATPRATPAVPPPAEQPAWDPWSANVAG